MDPRSQRSAAALSGSPVTASLWFPIKREWPAELYGQTLDLNFINNRMIAEAEEPGRNRRPSIAVRTDWDEGCECRKPHPGMLFQAQREHNLDLTRTWFIGDDERDAQAADAACCPCQLVSDQIDTPGDSPGACSMAQQHIHNFNNDFIVT